ncbi:unnamed protein product [Arctogadus glacialis]
MEIEQAIKEKNPMDTSIELLMACGNKLVAPKLHSGQELGGLMLHKIYKAKALYVRPSNYLSCKLDSTDSEDSMELDEEDNRSASNDHSMTTRGRNRRARANQPLPQVPSDQPPPQVPSDQPPPQEPRYQPPQQAPRYQPPQQAPSYLPPPQVPSDLQTDNSLSRSALVSDNYDTYLSIMGAMPDLSSDEEVNEAILASLESHP